jgi:hypothetical protein
MTPDYHQTSDSVEKVSELIAKISQHGFDHHALPTGKIRGQTGFVPFK